MNKYDRIKAAIAGERPDEVPYSFWTHLPGIDLDPEKLAQETFDFYKKYDVDFIKTMNNGMYSIEDYGCVIDYSKIESGGVAELIKTPISSVEDWTKIKAADISKGALERELKSLKLLTEKTVGEVPVLFTVFSPLTTALKLSENMLPNHIKSEQGAKCVHAALREITKSTCELAAKAIEYGASGIFFASQTCNYNTFTERDFLEFGKKYDVEVINSANRGWFNVLHAHGDNIIFNQVKDYPVDVFNWHTWETLPEIDEAIITGGKCIMGGLKRFDITNNNKNEIHNQIFRSIKKTNGLKCILSPGCVIRYPLNTEALNYVKQTKNDIEGVLLPREEFAYF